jgi:thioesterase domain-containing protein
VSDLDVKTNPTPKTWDIYAEVFTSIYTNANFQAKQYCDKIKNHPVFGKGDFNIIGISQGGLLARDMI